MSTDLLVEYDGLYQAPKTVKTIDQVVASNEKASSALDDLAFFETSIITPTTSSPSSRTNEAIPKPQWGKWSRFNESEQATDPWYNLGSSALPGNQSRIAGHQKATPDPNECSIHAPKPGIIRASTSDLFGTSISVLVENQAVQQEEHVIIRDMLGRGDKHKLLFDADALSDEDDEFGDFETVGSPTPQADVPISRPVEPSEWLEMNPPDPLNNMEALGGSLLPYPQPSVSTSFRERTELVVATSSSDRTTSDGLTNDALVSVWPSYEVEVPTIKPNHDSPTTQDVEDEDWGEFADLPMEASEMDLSKGVVTHSFGRDPVEIQTCPVVTPEPEVVIPTNIPPPSVLLAIMAQLLNIPQSSLFQAVANRPTTLKSRILSDPLTIDFLRSYILLATVAARIIAGRKLRWKRDFNLSQAMKIGPAGSRAGGGMKLLSLDKAESSKEEQEATEIVRNWKASVGRLKSAVAIANSSLRDPLVHLVVPEIMETILVRTVGTISAPRACIICGLKREERIPKVDHDIEDSFGEWWVEHWGHRLCRNFWQEHERELRS